MCMCDVHNGYSYTCTCVHVARIHTCTCSVYIVHWDNLCVHCIIRLTMILGQVHCISVHIYLFDAILIEFLLLLSILFTELCRSSFSDMTFVTVITCLTVVYSTSSTLSFPVICVYCRGCKFCRFHWPTYYSENKTRETGNQHQGYGWVRAVSSTKIKLQKFILEDPEAFPRKFAPAKPFPLLVKKCLLCFLTALSLLLFSRVLF